MIRNTQKMLELYEVSTEHLGNCKKEIDILTEYATRVSDEIKQSDDPHASDLTYSSNIARASQRLQNYISEFQNQLELMSETHFKYARKKEE